MADVEKIAAELRENLASFDAEVAYELENDGERADLWTDIDVPVEGLRALLDELSRLREENEKLRADLAFADERSAKVEALLEPHVQWECASEGCGKPATVHFERGGIGSYYCRECYMRVQALPARVLSEREGQE